MQYVLKSFHSSLRRQVSSAIQFHQANCFRIFHRNATYKADISNDLADRGLHFIPAPAAGCGCSGACKAGDHDRVEPDHWGGCQNVITHFL